MNSQFLIGILIGVVLWYFVVYGALTSNAGSPS